MRKSGLFLSYLAVQCLVLILFFVQADRERQKAMPLLSEETAMVEQWGLTDLCLFTEARYTRHPSQADLQTAFQDHPFSLEHFPSGSIISPPERIRRFYGNVAQ
ncbi:MAG: hypothetical protein HGA78_09775 [Nitrospirales bacterium]|nr:hypothetical protein [Nitrospirales bacterium]